MLIFPLPFLKLNNTEALSSYNVHADVYIFNSPPTHLPTRSGSSVLQQRPSFDTEKLYKDESFPSQVSGKPKWRQCKQLSPLDNLVQWVAGVLSVTCFI